MAFYYTFCVMRLFKSISNGVRVMDVLQSKPSFMSCIPIFLSGRARVVFTCHRTVCNDSLYNNLSQRRYSLNNLGNCDEGTSGSSGNIPNIFDKVKYNCILAKKTVNMSWHMKKKIEASEREKERERRKTVPDIPISLRYMCKSNDSEENTAQGNLESIENVVLPFHQENKATSHIFGPGEYHEFYSDRAIDSHENFSKGIVKTKGWMKDYEFYNEYEENNDVSPWRLNYGTPDRSVPLSSVPCGGCGAYLQCQDTGIPGYLPSELIKHCTIAELRALKCQRCHFLERYNMALNLSVSPDEYPKLLARMKNEYALALLLVDITDFPCSLWPGIINIIGTKRPVIVVGNKIDLLPCDSPHFLSNAQYWLEQAVQQTELVTANIKHVTLVSAYTGFGVEQLITKLHTTWEYRGDVYLLGCTNVGKSTLFNALLQSDYCKVQAVDIMQRATTSLWPGTTLNLLKFPIFRPEGWRLFKRVQRLKNLQSKEHEKRKSLRVLLKKNRNPRLATLIGHIGCTFQDTSSATNAGDPFSMRPSESGGYVNLPGLNPNRKDFVDGKWCYDTPGTIHPDQIIDILTAQELVHLLPREMILPRTFVLNCGDSLLIAGLARLDLESGAEKCRFTVFASNTLPITVCCTVDVEEVYKTLAASNLLLVPSSKPERLIQWPGLSPHAHSFNVTGIAFKESCADIVLSSAGWIAVTPAKGEKCIIRAWTPFARGIHFRQPPLLRFSVNLRGKKMRGSPAYFVGQAVSI